MFDTVKKWLDDLKLNYTYNEPDLVFHLPYTIEGKNFTVIIALYPEKWIKIGALIVESKNVPKGLDRALLMENWHLFDVTYGMDENGHVFSENDIPYDANFESFRSELSGVVFGVTHFFKTIAPKFSLVPEDTTMAYK